MRKALIIALGLANLGAIASVQAAHARSFVMTLSTASVCRQQNIQCNKDTHGAQVCANTYLNCLHPTVQLGGGASGPGPAPDQSQRRNIRAN